MSECHVCETGKYKQFSLGEKICEKHDICIDCGVKRKELSVAPWVSRYGAFQCHSCEKEKREQRIAERQAVEIDCDYTDEVVCPYCGYEHSDSWEFGDADEGQCQECGKEFEIEVTTTITYTTKV